MFGYTSAELVGRAVPHADTRRTAIGEDHILSRLRKGERSTLRDGPDGEGWAAARRRVDDLPVRDDFGTVIGASKIIRDITTVKQMEAERIRLLQEAATVTETLNNVGAIVASDLDRDKVAGSHRCGNGIDDGRIRAFFYNVVNESGEMYTLNT
jgi:hypothetical protein